MSARKLTAYLLVLSLTTASLVLVSLPAAASSGSADAYGYQWVNNRGDEPTVTYDWKEISATGTSLGWSYVDNTYAGPYDIGFTFTFYGVAYTQFYVSANGFLTFGSGYDLYYNYPIPNTNVPNNVVAPFWDDLMVNYAPYNYGAVYYETIGTAPDQQLVVQFDSVSRSSDYDLITFEVILCEAGEIWFQYETMSGETGNSATIGIENSDGAIGCQYSYNQATVSDGLAVMFFEGPVGFGPDRSASVYAGTSASYWVTVRNAQAVPDTFSITAVSALGWTVNTMRADLTPLTDTGELAPGESLSFIAQVEVPFYPSAPMDTAQLTATSLGAPSVEDSLLLNTTAIQARFTDFHSDVGYDSDADGDYDYLALDVAVEVAFAGQVGVACSLTDSEGTSIGYTYSSWDAAAGPNNQTLYLSGEEIRMYAVDGAFTATLYLYDYRDWYIGSDEYTTGDYVVSSFDPPPAMFLSPVTDEGVDTDSDWLYNYLLVGVPVEVFEAGQYTVVGILVDYGYSEIDRVTVSGYYSAGAHTLDFEFSGAEIYSSGFDGPYVVDLSLYQGEDDYLQWTYHETAAYLHTDFEAPGAMFTPPHDDYPEDTDGDWYYNHLVIEVGIYCYDTGLYDLVASVYDPSDELFVEVGETLSLTSGATLSYEIILDGHDIRGLGMTGRFEVDLHLYDHGTGIEQDQSYHETSYYYYWDFELSGVNILGVDDYAVDTDGDGYYNDVVLTVYIEALETADYLVVVEVDLYYYGIEVGFFEDLLQLEEGVVYEHELVLTYDEFAIYGVDPYMYVTVRVYDETGTDLYATHYDWTSYYGIYSFDRREAYFEPPHSDQGRDDDSDSLYESIVVSVGLLAPSMSGYYDLQVEADGPGYIDYLESEYVLFLEEGEVTYFDVEIPAAMVHNQGSGYWYLQMYLLDHFTGDWYDSDYYYTDTYYFDEFELPAVEFSYPHTDSAIDLDGDYLYDYLMVEALFACYEPGTYTVRADLIDYYGGYISSLVVVDTMTVGNERVRLMFDGWMIYYYGWAGYFTVEMTVEDSEGRVLDMDTHTTSYYGSWNFELPPASFSWPHSDHAPDSDGDGKYDCLIVNVSVEAEMPGMYVVTGQLYDYYSYFVDEARTVAALREGTNTVQLRFDAWPISFSYSDPNVVYLQLSDEDMVVMDEDVHYLGTWYYRGDFDSTRPFLSSSWAYTPPVIDGSVSADEWFGAEAVDLSSADDMNDIGGAMYILNDHTHLYILIDASGDATSTDMDGLIITFDTGGDRSFDYGHEDVFVIQALGSEAVTAHFVYNYLYPYWAIHCSPFDGDASEHGGLSAAIGFGPTGLTASPHRVYEVSIPLSLLLAAPGDTLGFGAVPAAYDADTDTQSSWPWSWQDIPDPEMCGDLLLSKEPPLTVATLSGDEGDGGWFVSSVEVELTATGGTGGVNATYYSLDGGDWQEYSAPFAVSGDGTHQLRFYSDDADGNEESVRTVSVRIDTVAPVTSASVSGTEGDLGWVRSVATLTFTAVDPASGLAVTMYRMDGGAWTPLTGSGLQVSEEGEHTVEYYSVDVAGHTEAARTVQFKVDMTVPVTAAAVDGSKVTLTATDNVSGVAVTWYRVDGGEWTEYTGEFEVEGEGMHVVEYFSTDEAGNNETAKSVSVEGSSGGWALSLDWWMVVLISVIIILIAIGAVFGMRRKAKESDARAAFKDMPSVMAQMVDDARPPPPQQGQPPQGDGPQQPPGEGR